MPAPPVCAGQLVVAPAGPPSPSGATFTFGIRMISCSSTTSVPASLSSKREIRLWPSTMPVPAFGQFSPVPRGE
jgi:hypothetical protein